MLKLQSQKFEIPAQTAQVSAYLAQTSNYQFLLPANQTSEFKCSASEFSFKAAGQVSLSLEKKEVTDTMLYFKGAVSNPFAFDLTIYLKSEGQATNGYIEINAELNMMLKMLIEKPLQKLLVDMAANLTEQLSSGM
jgi:carbon monoxide dehydrogenase subunit G